MLADEHEDSKLEISILQLRAINNEDRQKGVWLKNIRRHAEQDHEYHSLKEIILKGFLDRASGVGPAAPVLAGPVFSSR